jgi:hypothetical protein
MALSYCAIVSNAVAAKPLRSSLVVVPPDFSRIVYKMNNLNWSKPRELPEWAKQIFSPEMLAAGNINTEEEMDKLTNVVIDNLDHYLYNVGCSSNMENYLTQYNKYCKFQKMNPHALAMMINIGVDEQIFKKFRDDILFPELSC